MQSDLLRSTIRLHNNVLAYAEQLLLHFEGLPQFTAQLLEALIQSEVLGLSSVSFYQLREDHFRLIDYRSKDARGFELETELPAAQHDPKVLTQLERAEAFHLSTGTGSILAEYPLFSQTKLYGLLRLKRNTPEPFSETSQRFFKQLIITTELAIAKQHDRDLLARQSRELKLLDRVRTAVAKELDFEQLLAITVEHIHEVFKDTRVFVYLLKGDKLVLNNKAGPGDISIPQIALNEGIMGHVARSKTSILVKDVRHESAYIGDTEETHSEIALPLMHDNQVIGVLNVESINGTTLNKADLNLLSALSEQINIAIGRSRLYEEARNNEARFRLLAENMSDIICLHAPDGSFAYVSPSGLTTFGRAPEEILGQLPFEHIHPDDQDIAKAQFEALIKNEKATPTAYRFRHANGQYIWIETVMQAVRHEDGSIKHWVSSTRDISERKEAELALKHRALHDDLTGLPNRALFVNRLEHALDKKKRDPRSQHAVLFLDLDRFKLINDSLGHLVGDALLIELAKRLEHCVRVSDTVARLGGDEFAILLEDLGQSREAKWAAERILRALMRSFKLEGHEVFTGTSIGIAYLNTISQSAQDLLRNADIAMYRAKRSGGDTYAIFDRSMHERALKQMTIETDLRHALERDEFHLYYQPVYDLRSNGVVGFEALIRWQHAKHGKISPEAFIPLAEDNGLIIDIDQWVLREASRQMMHWQEHFPLSQKLTVSVNLSARHFMLEDVAERVATIVKNEGLATSRLRLEVTESAIMHNAELGATTLAKLRADGINVQVDDFGTGYSSLGYLHSLPLDSLKIDRSFVMKMDDQRRTTEIVRTIVALGRSLGLDVVAEGIETPVQLAHLAKLGCVYGQGYFIARPLSVAQVEKKYLEGLTTN